MYRWLVYLHISSVILSVGPYFILLSIIPKMREANQNQLQIYVGVFRSVVRLTKHAGHLLVITGVLLIWIGDWSWTTPWLLASLTILMSALFFIMRAFSPALRELLDTPAEKEKAIHKLTKSIWVYIIIMLFVMWLMVMKPALWFTSGD